MSILKEKLVSGDNEARKAIKHIIQMGFITVSEIAPEHIWFNDGLCEDEVYVDYDSYAVALEVMEELKKEGYSIFKLECEFDTEIRRMTCGCRKDNIRKKAEQRVKDAQALFMNCMQYKINDPANVTEVEISEFKEYLKERNMDAFNEFENLREQYRIQEV